MAERLILERTILVYNGGTEQEHVACRVCNHVLSSSLASLNLVAGNSFS